MQELQDASHGMQDPVSVLPVALSRRTNPCWQVVHAEEDSEQV